MPKINADGQPSYDIADEEVGTVTNAVGEQFEPNAQEPETAEEPQPVDEPQQAPKKSAPTKK